MNKIIKIVLKKYYSLNGTLIYFVEIFKYKKKKQVNLNYDEYNNLYLFLLNV
jgi:hypothetical protein